MNFKNKSSGDVVTAWPWDGHDEISLQQMLLNLPYTVEDGSVVIQQEDNRPILITPGTYIVNGPAAGQFRTMEPSVFESTYEVSA
jgi:hypothetical protein